MSDWKSISLGGSEQLYKTHKFTYMCSGTTYHLEVDEFQDGKFSGHGQHSTDNNSVLASVSGASVEECLAQLVADAKGRG